MEETLKQKDSSCIRICLFGPESSGKSTLSRKLSEHYNAPLVPEYAREYLQNLWDSERKVCQPEDLLPIAHGQMKLENEALSVAKDIIICDTDLLTTKVYSEAYYNEWCPEIIKQMALKNQYDLYILTDIDVPWTPDDLRDRPERREEMFKRFKNALDITNRPYVLVQGSVSKRMTTATTLINNLLL